MSWQDRIVRLLGGTESTLDPDAIVEAHRTWMADSQLTKLALRDAGIEASLVEVGSRSGYPAVRVFVAARDLDSANAIIDARWRDLVGPWSSRRRVKAMHRAARRRTR